jgi:hypothetical protein
MVVNMFVLEFRGDGGEQLVTCWIATRSVSHGQCGLE